MHKKISKEDLTRIALRMSQASRRVQQVAEFNEKNLGEAGQWVVAEIFLGLAKRWPENHLVEGICPRKEGGFSES